jgi:hypothetical protein
MIPKEPAVHGSEGQPVTQPTMHQSPVRLVITIALSVLVSEAFVMIIISFLQPSSVLFEVLFDSTFLVVLLSPMFYFSIFRPLVLHITGRVRAEEALEEHSERLEDVVEQRTAELRESEEKLRAQYKGIPVPTYTWQGVEDDFVLDHAGQDRRFGGHKGQRNVPGYAADTGRVVTMRR